MGVTDIFLVIMYLTTIASGIHLPQVHEDLNEKSPEYKRSTRQLAERKHIQSMFNYLQPDRLKAKYHHQQQADFRNLKSFSSNPISKSNFNEDDHDWKPFQPNYESPVKSKLETFSSKKLKSNYRKPKYVLMRKFNDSDVAGSEDNTETVKSDHQDPNNPLVYVTSDLLMNNFGLDNKATEQVLQNSATNDKSNPEQLQFEQILENHVELEGLHKILLDSKRTPESQEPTGVRIEHNGSPQIPLESLQQQLDAVNKAQAEQVLTAAQKQAESHVKAQHEAIALAQKKAEEEVLAKIAAHNQGVSLINVEHLPTPQNTIEHSPPTSQQLQEQDVEVPFKNNAPEVSALQGRPLDQVIVNPIKGYSGYYASAAQDLRNAKPRVQGGYAYRPVTLARPHEENVQLPYFSALPPLFNPKKVQIYSPVSPYTPHFEPSPTKHTLLIPEIIKPTDPTINTIHEAHYETNQNQDVVFTTPTSVKNLYAEEPLNDGVSIMRHKRSVKKDHINYGFDNGEVVIINLDSLPINEKSSVNSDFQRKYDVTSENPKSFNLVINNNNSNEGANYKNHVSAYKDHNMNINNIQNHIPKNYNRAPKTVKPKRKSFIKIIPKVERAEQKVFKALMKVG